MLSVCRNLIALFIFINSILALSAYNWHLPRHGRPYTVDDYYYTAIAVIGVVSMICGHYPAITVIITLLALVWTCGKYIELSNGKQAIPKGFYFLLVFLVSLFTLSILVIGTNNVLFY